MGLLTEEITKDSKQKHKKVGTFVRSKNVIKFLKFINYNYWYYLFNTDVKSKLVYGAET